MNEKNKGLSPMSKRDDRDQRDNQNRDLEDGANYATCLHCNNPFRVSEGVVTPDAAICDVCNGR
ncbi:hypothetical protein ACM25N_18780 [Roseovarius sp. C7]|uniref:hypothetical protein n=1 Tax=Roseovarius sp. C7 TaxID=3398643 RepID=UPI0039F6E309